MVECVWRVKEQVDSTALQMLLLKVISMQLMYEILDYIKYTDADRDNLCCSKGLALPVGPCSPGYYCAGGATEARPTDGATGSICPTGTYCGKPAGLLPLQLYQKIAKIFFKPW